MLPGNTPGVYIKEISTLPASIASVPTAIPAFIGYTEMNDGSSTPVRISSMLDFIELFGGPKPESFTIKIEDQVDSNSVVTSRLVTVDPPTPIGFNLYYSLKMFFSNGGGSCYIVSIGTYTAAFPTTNVVDAFKGGIAELEKVDEPTLLVFPDAINLADEIEYGEVVIAALIQCDKLQDRFTIADVKLNGTATEIKDYREKIGMGNLKYGAAYYPLILSTLNYGFDESALSVSSHNQTGGTSAPTFSGNTLVSLKSTNPSIYRQILAEINKHHVTLPPSGAIAGVYARVDADRGVWKAPANVSLNSVIGPSIKLTNAEQDGLNIDATSGKSINAIRTFAGKGTLVWGARTLAGNDNEWRYVPVRRLYIYVEESVKKATEFVVFEPNDANTWVRTKSMIENFLTKLWRDGALAGAKPEDAFFVKVGLGETMTSQDILEGIMNIEIGMAAVRPAEFIILKFSHKLQE